MADDSIIIVFVITSFMPVAGKVQKMFVCFIAYRLPTGEIEGFKGTALSGPHAAEENAISKVREKLAGIAHATGKPVNFDAGRYYNAGHIASRLSAAECKQIREDWKLCQ